MGLFAFLRRKRPPTQLDERNDEKPSIHYVLAHWAFRDFAFADPLRFLATLSRPVASRKFIRAILPSVCQRLQEPASFGPDAIKVHVVPVKGFPCPIIEMPEPGEIAEAYFTCLVPVRKPGDESLSEHQTTEFRYFALERGFDLDGTPRTVFCEWDQSGHVNYGDGPEPTVEGFARAIEDHLK